MLNQPQCAKNQMVEKLQCQIHQNLTYIVLNLAVDIVVVVGTACITGEATACVTITFEACAN